MTGRTAIATPRLCQIAICAGNAALSRRFYAALLGLVYTGRFRIAGATAARLLELPEVRAVNHWMAGAPDFFQLELFEFHEPPPAHPRPNAPGYERIVVETDDPDAVPRRLQQAGVSAALEHRDGAAFIRDPDGVLIELRHGRGVPTPGRIVGVRLVVADAGDAVRFFRTLGLAPAARDAAVGESVRMVADGGWIDIVRDHVDGAMRRLTERGLMNVALGLRRPRDFAEVYDRVLADGFTASTSPLTMLVSNVVYLRSKAGVSVELLQLPSWMDPLWGFRSPGLVSRAVQGATRALIR